MAVAWFDDQMDADAIVVLHCIPDSDDPYQLVADLMDAVPEARLNTGPPTFRGSRGPKVHRFVELSVPGGMVAAMTD